VVAPDAAPEGLEAPAYLKAAAALESAGRHQAALTAFDSALAVWPADPTARLGRANNLYLLGRPEEAEAAYRAVLDTEPGHPVALHNLVTLLVEEGRACAAQALLPARAADEPALFAAARAVVETAVAAQGRDCP
jgi:tetratricopeptide (TPR) repeat protein